MKNNLFGEELELLLLQRGWSAAQLAEAIGVDVSYVRRLVAGGRVPVRKGVELVERISAELVLTSRKKETLMNAFRTSANSLDSNLTPNVAQLGKFIDRLLGDASSQPLTRAVSQPEWKSSFHGDVMLVPDISAVMSCFNPHPNATSYILTPENLLSDPALPAIFEHIAKSGGIINHFLAETNSAAAAISVLENVFRISSAIPGSPDRYRIINLDDNSSIGLFVNRAMICLAVPISSQSGRLLLIRVDDGHLCRLACGIMQGLSRRGRHLVSFKKEGTSEFQESLYEIEDRSSTRVGMFDEGLSFLTHPPAWYSDNSSFEDKAPWRLMQGADRRNYKKLLSKRLAHTASFLAIEEIVSERSLIQYLSSGKIGDEFYVSPFAPHELKEHISHLIEMIRTPEARYTLYVSADENMFVSNKSWAAYNGAAFFGKVVGGDSICAIIESENVAAGLRAVFDLAKKKCVKRFPSPQATADWLIARSIEMIH